MATSFDETPTWFEAGFYLETKLAKLIAEDPKGNWTRSSMLEAFAAADCVNPYDHYLAYGDIEGLSPNTLFNNAEYLAAKTAQMGSTWTKEMVAKAIADADMTLMQHYVRYGSAEGLSPSSMFTDSKYYEAKLDQVQTAEPDKGWTLETLKDAFAAANLTPLEHYLAYAKTEGLDKHDYSANGAPIPHPGNTKIVLTTGADVVSKDAESETLRSSDRDDVISALVSTSSKSTLNSSDVIDGGAGVDTLKVDLAGSSFHDGFKTGSVKNVENIVLENANARTFNAKNVEDVQTYTVDGGVKNSTTTISNVNTAATDYVLKQEIGKFVVQINDGALTGKEDNVDVTLNGVGTGVGTSSRVTLDIKGTSATGKVEGITLVAKGDNNFVTLGQGHKSIVVDGAGNIDVIAAAGAENFNASNATGEVTANLTNGVTTLKSITGGEGNDNISVGNAYLVDTVFNGGEGKDTLTFTGAPTMTATPTISGFEKIVLSGNATSGLNGTKVTDVTEIVLQGVYTSADITKLANTELTISADSAGGTKNHTLIQYDGKGDLNFQLVDLGADATTSVQTVDKLTANNVETLFITNADTNGDTDSLTLTEIEARSATEMYVDTGAGATTTLDTGAHALGSVETLTITGTGAFTDVGSGSFTSLTEVDASGLGGAFTYTLHSGTKAALTDDGLSIIGSATATNIVNGTAGNDHVNFTGGTGTNTYTTTASGGKDTLILGDQAFNIDVGVTGAADLGHYVTVENFDSDDVLKMGGANDLATFTAAKTDLAVGVMVTGTVAATLNALTAADLKTFMGTAKVTVTAGSLAYFALANGDDVAIYAVTLSAKTNGALATADFKTVDLVGILNDTTLASLNASNFTIV